MYHVKIPRMTGYWEPWWCCLFQCRGSHFVSYGILVNGQWTMTNSYILAHDGFSFWRTIVVLLDFGGVARTPAEIPIATIQKLLILASPQYKVIGHNVMCIMVLYGTWIKSARHSLQLATNNPHHVIQSSILNLLIWVSVNNSTHDVVVVSQSDSLLHGILEIWACCFAFCFAASNHDSQSRRSSAHPKMLNVSMTIMNHDACLVQYHINHNEVRYCNTNDEWRMRTGADACRHLTLLLT